MSLVTKNNNQKDKNKKRTLFEPRSALLACRGPTLAYVGHRWPVVCLRGPTLGVVGPRWLVVGLRGPTLGLLMAFGWGGGTLRVVEENSTPGSRLRATRVLSMKRSSPNDGFTSFRPVSWVLRPVGGVLMLASVLLRNLVISNC